MVRQKTILLLFIINLLVTLSLEKLLYESLKFMEVVITFVKDKYQIVSMVVDPSYSKSGEHIREFCR